MAERDWRAIASEYIEGEEGLRALAARHAIPFGTICARARREGWAARRRAARAGLAGNAIGGAAAAALEKTAETSFGGDPAAALEKTAALGKEAERIFRVTDKLVLRAEELLDGGEIGARELAELMRAIKNAKEIKMLCSALDEREQQARVRALEEKLEPPRREVLRIEFSPEAEEAAR